MNISNLTLLVGHCSSRLSHFQHVFGQIYPYAALVICLVSMASNFSNIIILGQRKMGSSTNTILLAIATSDILVCISQIPLIISQNNPNNLNYYFWTVTYLCTTNAALLAHTVSLWLGVILGLFRLIYIRLYPSTAAKIYFGIERAKIAIILMYFIWIVLLIPYLTTMRIQMKYANNITYFIPTRSTHNSKLEMFTFWNIAIFGKILPCALTFIFGCCLLSTLKFARHRHDILLGVKDPVDKSTPNTNHRKSISARLSRRARDHRRTTRLLVSIILLVLPTELPIACLMLATRIKENIKCIYLHLGDVLDFLSLLKNFLTFVLYCLMSAEYRNEFKRHFLPFLVIRQVSKNTRELNNSKVSEGQFETLKPKSSISNNTDASKSHLIPGRYCPSTSGAKESLTYHTNDANMNFLSIHDIERSVSSYCHEQ